MDNVGYFIIILIGAGIVLVVVLLMATLSKNYPK